ncbi:MAG: MFS transporter [Bacteroidota bacterium]
MRPHRSESRNGWRNAWRALESRNYRLFFMGQGLSLIGTWMTFIARSWLIYRLTGSAAALGISGFLSQIPSFFLAPFAGVLIDRVDRRKVLLITQALVMLHSFTLAFLTLTGRIEVWHIYLLSGLQGFANAFDMPTRQAFVVDMVERKEDLGNAITLNSALVNGARMIGPSIAGFLIAAFGEGVCFLLDGLSYCFVLGAIRMMRLPPRTAPPKETPVLHDLREGFRYLRQSTCIQSILALLALVSLMGMPYTVLMPIVTREVFGGGPNLLGLLLTVTGAGALVGLAFLATRTTVLGFGKIIPASAALFGAGLVVFSCSRVLWLSLPFLLVIGFGMVVEFASSNTLLQTIVDEDKRGRVMSFYTVAFQGMSPFGSLLAGTLATAIGAPRTLLLGGVSCLIGAVLLSSRLPAIQEEVRPIYRKLGILPEVTTGIQSTRWIPPREE